MSIALSLTLALLFQANPPPAAPPAAPPDAPPAAPLDASQPAILRKLIDYMGGAEKLAAVKSLKVQTRGMATNTAAPAGGAAVIDTVSWVVLPDSIRREIKRTAGPNVQQAVIVLTPQGAWQKSERGIRAMTGSELELTRRSAYSSLSYLLQQPASGRYQFTPDGAADVNGVQASRLKITGPYGVEMRLLIDPQTGRILRRIDAVPGGEQVTDFDEWQEVDGLMLPRRWRVTVGPQSSQVEATSYQINPKIEEEKFQKPDDAPTTQPQ